MNLDQRMQLWLDRRQANNALRKPVYNSSLIDFCSNDYLGLARSQILQQQIRVAAKAYTKLGATGSRLLTGHHPLISEIEQQLANFHCAESTLLFNSGYDANLGLLACLPRRRDLILYDNLVHASIHDGMRMSSASSLAFGHNDIEMLERLLQKNQDSYENIFVLAESVYSMDGDAAPLEAIAGLCKEYEAYLIVDEAHATGVFGDRGEGLVVQLGLENQVFARLHTFGKAMGVHGAVLAGSKLLTSYLFNYARSLIYTTALPMHSLVSIQQAYQLLEKNGKEWIAQLREKINWFRLQTQQISGFKLMDSESAIQSVLVAGNQQARNAASLLQQNGLDVRAILSPTVPAGSERLRICLHLFNSREDLQKLLFVLAKL